MRNRFKSKKDSVHFLRSKNTGRDLNQFRKQGYVTNKLELVDLFPYTDHIESVCVLEKKQFNAKPTKKAQRQAQFRSSKMSKKKR